MKAKSLNVKLIGKKDEFYLILFMKLQTIVEVNKDLFQKMLDSELYNFRSEMSKRYESTCA